jgi:hypothetical protein
MANKFPPSFHLLDHFQFLQHFQMLFMVDMKLIFLSNNLMTNNLILTLNKYQEHFYLCNLMIYYFQFVFFIIKCCFQNGQVCLPEYLNTNLNNLFSSFLNFLTLSLIAFSFLIIACYDKCLRDF